MKMPSSCSLLFRAYPSIKTCKRERCHSAVYTCGIKAHISGHVELSSQTLIGTVDSMY